MKFRKITALLLVLCMMLSLSISAFAADDVIASGTISDSKIRWELDSRGWLTISGSGEAPVFTCADDQPWAEYRDQITQVWFDDMGNLKISDLAYWFEDCTALTTAEIPDTTPVIGRHAFYNCSKLSTLTIYYGENILESIGEDAFWRETDSGDTLYIGYLIGYPKSTVPFHTYDWAGSNRSERYFYDLYGVYQNADADTSVADSIKEAPEGSIQSTGSIVGNCPSCGKNSLQGTYVEQAHTASGHQQYFECYLCHYVQNLGTYVYKEHGPGTYGSWTCPSCGSHTWVLQNEQAAACTSNGYRNYSCVCGQTKSETIYASGHSMSYGAWSNYSDTQHSRTATCGNCGYSATEYDAHNFSAGSWSKYSDTQHGRSKLCSDCGASAYDYADHSYSYGPWVKADDSQHKRTKSCPVCGDSSEEYADHADANGDGKCDECGYSMTAVLTWDYGDGTFTTSQPYHAKLLLPDEPVKEGFTFDGWFTEKTGGTEVTGETVFTSDSPTTYYAHWSAIKTFSATVPVTLPLVVDESGNVHTGAAEIINASTGAVVVSSVSISSKNGWKLVPFSTNMAHEKVDAQLLGFRINDAQTTGNGDTETLALTAPWTIAANARLPIDYDAVVSAVSQPVTEQDVLNVLFVLEWDGE